MIHYPKAELRLIDRDGGEMQGGPARGVWHTTETSPTANYAKDYYHLNLAMVDGAPKWVQMIDLGRASRALRRPGDVQTNRQGDYCVNVSLSGYARQATEYPDAIYNEMAELMVWCEVELGIPAEFPYPFVGGNGYGESGAARLATQDWIDLAGWVGHQHVPHNTHWDPGRIPVAVIESKIELLKEAEDMPLSDEDIQKIKAAMADVLGGGRILMPKVTDDERDRYGNQGVVNSVWHATHRGQKLMDIVGFQADDAQMVADLVVATCGPVVAQEVADEIARRLAG